MQNTLQLSIDFVWKVLLTLVLFFFAASHSTHIVIPIIFSLFLAIILNPVVKFLERKGVNEVLAITIVLLVVLGALTGFIYYVSTHASKLIQDLPDLVKKFKSLIDRIGDFFNSFTGVSTGLPQAKY